MKPQNSIDLKSNMLDFVDSIMHSANTPNNITKLPSIIDPQTIISKLSDPQTASESLFYFSNFQLDQFCFLLNEPDIIDLILSFISDQTPQLVQTSLKILELLFQIDEFRPLLSSFIEFTSLIETTFSVFSLKSLESLSNILISLLDLIPGEIDPIITHFLIKTIQIRNEKVELILLRVIFSYLSVSENISTVLQHVNLYEMLNKSLYLLKYPKQLNISLKIIEILIRQIHVSCRFFDITQILKLMRASNTKIQLHSISIITSSLLFDNSEFKNKGQLCKSLKYIFVHSSIQAKLEALFCFQTFLLSYLNNYPQILGLFNDTFFDLLFSLLSCGYKGGIEAISFLKEILQNDDLITCRQYVLNRLLSDEIYQQLEKIADESEGIIVNHALMLLGLIDQFSDQVN